MLIGATLEKSEISYWQNKVLNNAWMRVFPNSDGLIPVTSDERFQYAKAKGMRTIYVSSKIRAKYSGSYSAGLAIVKTRLEALVDTGDFDMIYYTEHHEPEGDLNDSNPPWPSVSAYKADQLAAFAMVDSITPAKRAKIRVGHAHTRQWTESNQSGKGKYNYKTWDTGQGDFFGIDMYHDSWKPGTSQAVSTPVAPDTFLQYAKSYKYDANDTRPRLFPELGLIGMPTDTDTSVRAAWLQGVHNQLKTWGPATTGWEFIGWIWWNTEGTSGSPLEGLGTKRWFQLDRRHTGNTGSYTIVSDAKALQTWNTIAAQEWGSNTEPELPTDDPDPDDNQYQLGFAAGIASVQAQLQDKYDDGYEDGLAAGTADQAAAVAAAYDDGYAAGAASVTPGSKLEGRQEYHDEVAAKIVADLPPVVPEA